MRNLATRAGEAYPGDDERSSREIIKHLPISRCFNSPKLFLQILITISFAIFILIQICTFLPETTLLSSLKSSMPTWQLLQNQTHTITNQLVSCDNNTMMIIQKLRQSVTFLPLKDLRYADSPVKGRTWFMSSMDDLQEAEGEILHQHFASNRSNGRILCLKGNDTHDGTRNSYALAFPEALPENARLVKGLTFVSNNQYDYGNLWHGLTALFPLMTWRARNPQGCKNIPTEWWLYHWGELRTRISPWLRTLVEATCGGGGPMHIHGSDGLVGLEGPFCFEEAIVTRHNEGRMSMLKIQQGFELFKCRARDYCNVSSSSQTTMRVLEVNKKKVPVIGLTMFMRTGNRSFKNDSVVIDIFNRACSQFEGCQLKVVYANNLTFCQQVKVMSETDILVSPHGAQLTNLFFMNKNSSVLEFFPKGWLELAGGGQFIYHSFAKRTGMQHRGAWRDQDGPNCPNPEDRRHCMSFYKNRQIGHNDTYFTHWAKGVLIQHQASKMEEFSAGKLRGSDCDSSSESFS